LSKESGLLIRSPLSKSGIFYVNRLSGNTISSACEGRSYPPRFHLWTSGWGHWSVLR